MVAKTLHEDFLSQRSITAVKIGSMMRAYIKVTNLHNAKEMVNRLPNVQNDELVFIVYNFIDTLSHARTDNKVFREIAQDESAYRKLTLSWFQHSPLLEAIQFLSERKIPIIITTDHGSVKVDRTVKVVGERDTSTNLRYKTGKKLTYNNKDVFAVENPKNAYLPSQHMSSSFIFAKENDFFVYPNNLNHYAKYYRDTFQHGGVSMEEMIVPLIYLEPKS